jgi:hypothetical protein
MAHLRTFTWSSYRGYVDLGRAPCWLHTAKILELTGCRQRGQRARAYQQYTEQAIRQGLEETPWEPLQGQIILGGGKFLRQMQEILSGNARGQPSLRRVAPRAGWEAVVRAMERFKGEKWSEFVNRYGDRGRDLALYLGRKQCQLKLGELGRLAGGMDYASVAAAVARLATRLRRDKNWRVQSPNWK